MNNKNLYFLTFVVGVIVGSATTWQYTRKRYERIAQDEIDSVKEAFNKRDDLTSTYCSQDDVVEKATQAKEKPDLDKYAKLLRKQGYKNYSEYYNKDEKKEDSSFMDKPYVISPDEFGDIDDYEKIGLSYYADCILTDDNDEVIDDVDDIIGLDSLTHFGEYEDDSVFVRNNKLKCDYEILKDQRNYSEVVGKKPHQMED